MEGSCILPGFLCRARCPRDGGFQGFDEVSAGAVDRAEAADRKAGFRDGEAAQKQSSAWPVPRLALRRMCYGDAVALEDFPNARTPGRIITDALNPIPRTNRSGHKLALPLPVADTAERGFVVPGGPKTRPFQGRHKAPNHTRDQTERPCHSHYGCDTITSHPQQLGYPSGSRTSSAIPIKGVGVAANVRTMSCARWAPRNSGVHR